MTPAGRLTVVGIRPVQVLGLGRASYALTAINQVVPQYCLGKNDIGILISCSGMKS
jgi:hypothetical protein